MEKSDIVSIITPSYNCADYIAKTIQSISVQTYRNWELLITDDCSTDNSCEIIERFASEDSRIKLYRLSHNSGAGIARNNSIEKASGRFIAFCDSDDRWHPDKLEKQLEFMESAQCTMSHTSYMICDDNDATTGIVVCRRKESLRSMRRDDKMGFLTVIYDTSQIGKIYMPSLRKRQDWAFKLKVLQKCHYSYGMKEPLAYYRKRADSISSRKMDLIKYNIAALREVFGWSSLRASLYFYLIFMPSHLKKLLFLRQVNR